MIYTRYTGNSQELDLARRIAERIFGEAASADLQVFFSNPNCKCLILYEDDIPTGFGLVQNRAGRPEIPALGVLPKFRKQEYGDFILRTLTEYAFYHYNSDRVWAYSFPGTGGFFEQAGYHKSNSTKSHLGQYCSMYFIKAGGLSHKCTGCDECPYQEDCYSNVPTYEDDY